MRNEDSVTSPTGVERNEVSLAARHTISAVKTRMSGIYGDGMNGLVFGGESLGWFRW